MRKIKYFNTERQAENYLKKLGYRYSKLSDFWHKGIKVASVQGNSVVFHEKQDFNVKKGGNLITSVR